MRGKRSGSIRDNAIPISPSRGVVREHAILPPVLQVWLTGQCCSQSAYKSNGHCSKPKAIRAGILPAHVVVVALPAAEISGPRCC